MLRPWDNLLRMDQDIEKKGSFDQNKEDIDDNTHFWSKH